MDQRNLKQKRSRMKVQMIIGNIHGEIVLDDGKLLKLEKGQPGSRLMCTGGTLWLTQPGDPRDHLLKAGQSYPLASHSAVLVQGVPLGKALILPPA